MQNNIIEIIGFNPNNLPENDFNIQCATKMKLRGLFKIMLYVHASLNFEKHFDPDLNHHIIKYSHYTKKDEDYFPINYDPEVYTKTRIANCGIYSNYFELLARNLGFDVRHIGLQAPDGRCGHWCSEVKIDGKWIFFDSMYLICCPDENNGYYSAKDIMDDPLNRYFNLIPPLLQGISKTTILDLWKGLAINKETSYQLGKSEFFNKYYENEKKL